MIKSCILLGTISIMTGIVLTAVNFLWIGLILLMTAFVWWITEEDRNEQKRIRQKHIRVTK